MESNKLVETICNVSIHRDENNDRLTFDLLNNVEIDLTTDKNDDIETLFNHVFEYIITNKKLIQFEIVDKKTDLIHEVVTDIFKQLNKEISSSRESFLNIIDLNNQLTKNN